MITLDSAQRRPDGRMATFRGQETELRGLAGAWDGRDAEVNGTMDEDELILAGKMAETW